MTEHEFNNFRSYLKFLGYTVSNGVGEYDTARTYINMYGNGFIQTFIESEIAWSSQLRNPAEEITLNEASRMSKLGALVSHPE